MRWLCIFMYVYIYIIYTGYGKYPSIMAVQSTLTQPFSDIIRPLSKVTFTLSFPCKKGVEGWEVDWQSLDRLKTLQMHNVRTRPSSPLCPWRIYRCIEWVIGLGSFGAKVEECWCQMMWWYPFGFVPVISFLFTFCNCSHRIDVRDMFT